MTRTLVTRTRIVGCSLAVTVALIAASCGGSDSDGTNTPETAAVSEGAGDTAAATETETSAETDGNAVTDTASPAAGGGSAGTLILGADTISLDSARCFLEEQDAAAGGGKILFVAQAFGVDANGDEVMLDASRYDEDSQFTGDDILVTIGDPFAESAVNLGANADLGTMEINGSTVSADGLTFENFDDFSGSGLEGSFSFNC